MTQEHRCILKNSTYLGAVAALVTGLTTISAIAAGPSWFSRKSTAAVTKKAPSASDIHAASVRRVVTKKLAERGAKTDVARKIHSSHTTHSADPDSGPTATDFGFLAGAGLEGIVINEGSKHIITYNGKTLDQFLYRSNNGRVFGPSSGSGGTGSLNLVQGALYSAAISYFSELPALGGNPDRGFHPVIWPAMVRVAFENRLVMLPSGELLYPADSGFKYMVTGEKSESKRVDLLKAHIVVTDHAGNIMSENFTPILPEAVEDASGNPLMLTDSQEEMDEYSKGLGAFNNVFGALTLNSNLDMTPFAQRKKDTALMDKLEGPRVSWASCVGTLFRGLLSSKKRQEARECFELHKDQAMAAALNPDLQDPFIKELLTGVGRGAVSGLGVSAILGGTDLGSGSALGALMNGMRVVYNRYYKKEVITQQQIRDLNTFVDTYTFAPDSYGEVKPKKGLWMLRDGQMLIRYQTVAGYRRNRETGKTVPATAQVLLDIDGLPRAANAGWKIDNRSDNVRALGLENVNDSQRTREAARQVQRLADVQSEKKTSPEYPAAKTYPADQSPTMRTGPVLLKN